jgi:8-oxo-dGTP diphosphatase
MSDDGISRSEFMRKNRIISLTADVFIHDDDLNFILIKRSKGEFKDFWALPGGFVEYGETVENAAVREAKEETHIDVELEELVNVYSDPNRDSRGHIVTVAFTAKGDFDARKADSDAKDIGIFTENELKDIKIAFDHEKIIKDCLNKAKI